VHEGVARALPVPPEDAFAAPTSAKYAWICSGVSVLKLGSSGGISRTRMRVPFFGGASSMPLSGGSPEARSIGAGVARVFQTSKNSGP
jgi:hypothetical protein